VTWRIVPCHAIHGTQRTQAGPVFLPLDGGPGLGSASSSAKMCQLASPSASVFSFTRWEQDLPLRANGSIC
jgi:hypothetical protein